MAGVERKYGTILGKASIYEEKNYST